MIISVDIKGKKYALYYCSCIFFNVYGDSIILFKWSTTQTLLKIHFNLTKAIFIVRFSEKAASFWIISRRIPHKGQPEGQQIMHLCEKLRHEKTRLTLLSNRKRQGCYIAGDLEMLNKPKIHTFVHYIKDTTCVTGSFSSAFAYTPLSTGKAIYYSIAKASSGLLY